MGEGQHRTRPALRGGADMSPWDQPLRIGLVNNMPDAAYGAAERQFGELVRLWAGARPVELQTFSLPGVVRAPALAERLGRRQRPPGAIADAGLDAVIVTGAEPLAQDLREEPFWPALTTLVDWAVETGTPTLWSCLAAHAAVLHLDGVPRRGLERKLSGVFKVTPTSAMAPAEGAGGWCAPHSRLNTLDEHDLEQSGYQALTRSDRVGVDCFVRDGTPFLFCQGHLEYDAAALGLEFRRDFTRYLRGEQAAPPEPPDGYYAEETAAQLAELCEAARLRPSPALIRRWPLRPMLKAPQPVWRTLAGAIYGRWLQTVVSARVSLDPATPTGPAAPPPGWRSGPGHGPAPARPAPTSRAAP